MSNSYAAAVALRLLAAFLITVMSVIVRLSAQDVPVGQIIFWRSFAAILPITIYMIIRGEFPHALLTKYPKKQAIRATVGVFAMSMAFTSLAYLPVSMTDALGFLGPVLVLPLAAIFLGEKLTKVTVGATLLGLAGVMFVLWEALSLPSEGAVIGIIAGLLFALGGAVARILVKQLTGVERASTIAIYFAFAGTVAGLATWPFGWVEIVGQAAWLLGLAGIIGGLAHICATEALLRAPVSQLGPFEYTGLIWAAGFDIFLFGLAPGLTAWIGFALIFGAGLLILSSRPRVT